MQISFNINENKIAQDVQQIAEKHTTEVVKEYLGAQFQKEWKMSGFIQRPAGPMVEMIQKKIDDYFLSENFQNKIIVVIEEHLDKAMKDACQKRIEHHINKMVFSKDIPFQ